MPSKTAARCAPSSGSGNSPFGHGWSVGIPKIRRKTDKGLPTYIDGARDHDTFVFSEAEDLVPLLKLVGSAWIPDVYAEGDYEVARYRPRVEGAFARIERLRHNTTGVIWWRTRGADNVLRIYGQSESARLADPKDPSRVFEYCLEEARDELGSVARYEYKAETRAGVDEAEPAERRHAKMGVSYLLMSHSSHPRSGRELRKRRGTADPRKDGTSRVTSGP